LPPLPPRPVPPVLLAESLRKGIPPLRCRSAARQPPPPLLPSAPAASAAAVWLSAAAAAAAAASAAATSAARLQVLGGAELGQLDAAAASPAVLLLLAWKDALPNALWLQWLLADT
jgi:hypothetical protein